MDETAARVAVVAAVGMGAWLVGSLWKRWGPAPHPRIDPTGLPAGVVVFTSTTCATCKDALAAVRAAAGAVEAHVREVTFELEPHLQEAAGVESVPLTVVIDEHQRVVAQFTGVPRVARLRRALR